MSTNSRPHLVRSESLIMDSRVNNRFGWDVKKMWVEKNIGLEWQEAITKSPVQLDHGKLTPEIKTGRCYAILISPGPKICSCNLVIDWVLHLVVCCIGAINGEPGALCEIAQEDLGKLDQTRDMCVNKLCTYYMQHLPSSSDCGKPLNTIWQLLEKEEFDLPRLSYN